MSEFKILMDEIHSAGLNNKTRIAEDTQAYLMYNGNLRSLIREKILEEFKDKAMVSELQNRIIPVNIMKKIYDKLAKVYIDEPIRRPLDKNPKDQDLVARYEEAMGINSYMQYANRLFKLHKHSLIEPYLNSDGIPSIRALPSQSFSLFSDNPINPEKMTMVVKHLRWSKDLEHERHIIWTNENHWIVNGKGDIVIDEMLRMNNEEGLNPFGTIPFVHINQSIDMLYPIRSSDVTSVQMAVCLLLSDSALAQKYNSWGTLVVKGADGDQQLKVGPGMMINLPPNNQGNTPSAEYIQPKLNSDEVIRLIEKLIETVLTTNNLSAGTMIGSLRTSTAASGISKMLDEIESTEDIDSQRAYFINAEKEFWYKFAHNMLPVWVESDNVDKDYAGAFSSDFELDIKFKKHMPIFDEKENLEIIIMKLQNGFITKAQAIKDLNPTMSNENIEDLLNEIDKERADMFPVIESESE